MSVTISRQALMRMPNYLKYLKQLRADGVESVTATAIASEMGLNEIQVRKDVAAVSTRPGKPMVGFSVRELIRDMGAFLALENVRDAVIVGVGGLGSALMGYSGFAEYGMNIVAAFDSDPEKVGKLIHGKRVYAMGEMDAICRRLHILIGIITVPAVAAEAAYRALVQSGILAVWNFAPVHLTESDGILIQNESMTSSLAVLSVRLREMTRTRSEMIDPEKEAEGGL